MILKFTEGYVVQTWTNEGIFVGQKFFADESIYEDEEGNDLGDLDNYEPFDMVQPDGGAS